MNGSVPSEIADLLAELRAHVPPELYRSIEQTYATSFRVSQDYRRELKQLKQRHEVFLQEYERLKSERDRFRAEQNKADKERRLFQSLLVADELPAVGPYLDGVLRALVARTEAQKGVIILFSEPGDYRRDYAELIRYNYSEKDFEAFQDQIELSQGIVRRAISTRTTVYTEEAVTDQRFSEHASVQLLRLKTVLCAPLLGMNNDVLGVLYLEHRGRSDAFPEAERQTIELVVKQMARWVGRHLIVTKASQAMDHTRPHRQRYGFKEIIGQSEAVAEVLRLITVALDVSLSAPVLITGERGTGKSLVARALHFNGPWTRGPWVELDCLAEPADQLHVLLFGGTKGPTTGRERHQSGRLEQANQGTLFIRHVDKLPLESQQGLLEVLKERTILRLEDARLRTPRVQLVASTVTNLKDLVEKGLFLSELLYRFDLFVVHVPPLRDRPEDIPLLADYFLSLYNRLTGENVTLAAEAISFLQQLQWPGNVRELKEQLSKAAMHAPDGQITASLLSSIGMSEPRPSNRRRPLPRWKDATAAFQRQLIVDALSRTDRNLQEAAELLGISRQHLSRLLHELDLNAYRPSHRGRKSKSKHAKR